MCAVALGAVGVVSSGYRRNSAEGMAARSSCLNSRAFFASEVRPNYQMPHQTPRVVRFGSQA
jgi:hypothetical protein